MSSKFSSLLLVLCSSTLLSGCLGGSSTPKGLAEEACGCWNEMKAIDNQTAKARKADECTSKTQYNLAQLREIGVDKGWNNQQVDAAQKEFDSVYQNCQ